MPLPLTTADLIQCFLEISAKIKLMFVWFILFCFLLIILFFLSRSFSKNLYLLFFYLTKDKQHAVSLLTWVFLPGTVIHELSHLLMAELLRVRTGELSFTPEIRENNEIRVGALKMAKTDPLRHSLIGLAPILVGITTIASLSHFVLFPLAQKTFSLSFRPLNYQLLITNYFLLFGTCYLVLCVSNTMFSSKKDLEAILFPLIIIAVLGGAFWLGDFEISFSLKTISFFTNLFKKLNLALMGTVVIDSGFLGMTKILLKSQKQKTVNNFYGSSSKHQQS